MKSRRSEATSFSKETATAIVQRDRYQCLFCRLGKYGKSECNWIRDIMHYVNRSAGGLGIEQNGVLDAVIIIACWITATRDTGKKCWQT